MTNLDPSPRPRPIWADETAYQPVEPPAHAPTCHRGTIASRPGQLDPAHCDRCRELLRRITRRSGPPNLDSCPAAGHAARTIAQLHRQGDR